jgi:hypothetical protein
MSDNKQTSDAKPKGPFPHPAKNMTGDRATDETDAPRNPARAPGKRLLDREDQAAATGEGKDASGPAPDTAPQQSRETRREQH